MILSLHIGQSNQRGHDTSIGGNDDFGPGLMTWSNGENSFGTGFRAADWGLYPFDKTGAGGDHVNNLIQGFSVGVTESLNEPVYAVQIAKGATPIESFMTRSTMQAGGWTIPAGKAAMGGFIFAEDDGCEFPCISLGKPCYDVITWMQGEANTNDTAAVFAAKLTGFFAKLYERGLAGPNTVILMAGLFDGHPFYARHKSACQQVAASNPKARYVDSAGLLDAGDGVHFRGTAIINLGKRLANHYVAVA